LRVGGGGRARSQSSEHEVVPAERQGISMKEIDFLPEWYRTGRRRKVTYRTQYVALGGIFVIMFVWNYLTSGSISRAEAELAQIRTGNPQAQAAAEQFARLKKQMSQLQEKAALIEKIDSRINVASVLAELSFLIDDEIVLRRVELLAERFPSATRGNKPARSNGLVRAGSAGGGRKDLPLGDVRFKVVIAGVAASAADVAALICELEESPYFFQVAPSFSRNTQIKPGGGSAGISSDLEQRQRGSATNIKAYEFEISCYLANYRQQS